MREPPIWITDPELNARGDALVKKLHPTPPPANDPTPIITLKAPYDTAKLFWRWVFHKDDKAILYRHREQFYLWTGVSYLEASDAEIKARAYAFLDQCVQRIKDDDGKFITAPVKPKSTNVNEVLDALRALALLSDAVDAPVWLEQASDFDAKNIIACANGLLDLPTLELLPLTPTFYSHNALDYAFEPNAPEPLKWLGFLSQLWPNDQESIDTLQEIFGYVLVADTSQQKSFLVVGPRRSGKGTIGRVLRRLIGPANVVAPTLSGLGTQFGLEPMINKRLAIISDARLGGKTDQAVITERLLSISGEDAITVDRKFKRAWTGKLDARFIVLTNELPSLADASGALASRFIVLLLTQSFYGREDQTLTDTLLAELPGILNWAIAGLHRLRERGYFKQPESAKSAIRELEDLGSPIGAFVRDRCVIGQYDVSIDALYSAWEGWCYKQSREHTGNKQTFGRNLRAAVPSISGAKQRRTSSGIERYYEGLRLKIESELTATD